MKTNKIDSSLGNSFFEVAKEASMSYVRTGITSEFYFNGITCLVDGNTNLDNLYRYYCDAFIMDWKTVGTDCKDQYDSETAAELESRKEQERIKQEQRHAEMEAKDKAQKEEFEKKVAGVDISLKDAEKWKVYEDANQDPYGKCCVDYARDWARLMQAAMGKGETLVQCAERTSFELGFYGITGFMYGAAVHMLSECWEHGEELRKWHNKE